MILNRQIQASTTKFLNDYFINQYYHKEVNSEVNPFIFQFAVC